MKIKLSYKDLLLLIGIVVAVITLTTWMYNDMQSNSSATRPADKERTSLISSPSVKVSKLAQKAVSPILRLR